MTTLHLGIVDADSLPADPVTWLRGYHRAMAAALKARGQFRDDPNDKWQPFQSQSGRAVKRLQSFLKGAGFFPKADLSGIFGYGTKSALRLFQTYVRDVEGELSIGVPDGILGKQSTAHIKRWKKHHLHSTWDDYSVHNPSPDYYKWFDILQRARTKYLMSDDPVLQNLRHYDQPSDSLPPEQWTFRPADTHLIGIRCQPEVAFHNRPNDDLFILLIKGMVFTFWGSTDPNPSIAIQAGRHQEGDPFLSEGQHKYRFGWHKVSSAKRVYMALRPYRKGVLVFRDRQKRNQLLLDDVEKGFGSPNKTINIHWTPDGDRNWSAGCQVINGESYVDTTDRLVSCRDYCARNYSAISSRKTRGAYNVLTDLVVTYAPKDQDTVWYTLGRLENFAEVAPEFGKKFVKRELQRLMAR